MGTALTPRPPTDKPKFTLGDLRRAVPPRCFDRSLLRSSVYLVVDLIFAAAFLIAALQIDKLSLPNWAVSFVAWPAYWFAQGAVWTGVWVVAHECGHGAFCKYQSVNDAVGLLLHSWLLVPYFSWKHSHRRHHSNTGNVELDEVFVPKVAEKPDSEFHFEQLAPVRLLYLITTLTAGWPLYLIANVSGRKYDRFANHFDPYSPIFNKRERVEVIISDVALGLVTLCLYGFARSVGWLALVKLYLVPYLVVNFWLVMITLLQHTHPQLPHYADKEWDWLRGALTTVDRSYGYLDTVFNHITDTHVVHHLFSTIPHYHAQEATAILKPVLDQYYLRDTRPVFAALWQDWGACRYVAPEVEGSGVYWYQK